MARDYPFKWVDIPREEVEEAMRKPMRDYVRSVPGDVWMPKGFEEVAERIYNMEIRPDDIWIVTYPKCGTTWTQELIWQIVNNVDIEESRKLPLWARSPFLEFEIIAPAPAKEMLVQTSSEERKDIFKSIITDSINYTENLSSPRIIKSHLPLSMLSPDIFEKGCKIIYVCRNPKDTCVSFYHHNTLMKDDYAEDLQHFEKMFMNGTFIYGSYWHHLKDAWKYKDNPNLRIVWFEEMKKDFINVIRETSKFVGYHLTELKVLTLDDFLHIKNQKKHGAASLANGNADVVQAMSKFFRKGEVGDWKNYFTGEKLEEWDEWIQKNLEGTDIKIAFE